PWRDLPESFGSWKTAWKRHRRFSADGTWDAIHAALLQDADAAGEIDWACQRRLDGESGASARDEPPAGHWGLPRSQESPRGAA
ncbi:MAG TPA: transposase, partial [Steroidobacteraceae bacterium]|nr:transposase [Steroidobacteraceae bacterium]